jgi:hypothetical protein
MLEAAVGSNGQFISCHVLGCVDAMLGFIHAVGLLKLLAVLVHVHAAHNKSLWCLFVVCTHSSVFVVPSRYIMVVP